MIAQQLMAKLGVSQDDLLAGAYMDMLLTTDNASSWYSRRFISRKIPCPLQCAINTLKKRQVLWNNSLLENLLFKFIKALEKWIFINKMNDLLTKQNKINILGDRILTVYISVNTSLIYKVFFFYANNEVKRVILGGFSPSFIQQKPTA